MLKKSIFVIRNQKPYTTKKTTTKKPYTTKKTTKATTTKAAYTTKKNKKDKKKNKN